MFFASSFVRRYCAFYMQRVKSQGRINHKERRKCEPCITARKATVKTSLPQQEGPALSLYVCCDFRNWMIPEEKEGFLIKKQSPLFPL